jgi:mannose-6-phosphate isomerase
MSQLSLYPLRFDPIYEYRPWGGRRLANLLDAPLPAEEPIGEGWILSDRDDHPSLVADGSLKGMTIRQLLEQAPQQLLGKLAGRFSRFPLLLKFLDVSTALSVQVHPPDGLAELIPPGESGKTEAWVVLEAGPQSRIYAGLAAGTNAAALRAAIANGTVGKYLASFIPRPGESILIEGGTVHSLQDVVVFEVQENSDVTYRLYDWDHVDAKSGKGRPLQVDQAMACINFKQVAIGPEEAVLEALTPALSERLIQCDHFGVERLRGESPFTVGASETPRVLVCIAGRGELEYGGATYAFGRGDVVLLPAVVGACSCRPQGVVSLLEISLPELE